MSIFLISIIASNARPAAAGSGSVIALVSATGVIFQDNPHSEIARRLDLPLGTVKSRIRKAMIKLRTLLDDEKGGEA